MNLHYPWTAAFVFMLVAGWPPFALATTTTYEFSVPPDSVFVATTPGGTMQAGWPGQILDGGTALEENADVLFENDINNTIFIDSNALLVSNSSRMNGDFFWGDPRNNGPADPSFLVVDFTTEPGLLPREISFDFAVSVEAPSLEVQVFDSQNDMETIVVPTSGSFTHGLGTGSDGRAVLTPTGTVGDLARMRVELPPEVLEALQVGFDNFAITMGPPGDHNGDGAVDAADYALWRSDPSSYDGAQGYADWVNNFGQTAGSGSVLGSTSSAAVPEPLSIVLFVLGGVLQLAAGRKQ